MKIGWVVPVVGCFGAVREMVEVSNVLVRRGHDVTIFSPAADRIRWLPSLSEQARTGELAQARLDALLAILDWQPDLYDMLLAAQARVKAVCVMGIGLSAETARVLRGEQEASDPALGMLRDAVVRGFMLLPDSQYQCDWLAREAGVPAGPSIGGVNVRMFRPIKPPRAMPPWRVIHSGDPRPRKGTAVVTRAINIARHAEPRIKGEAYWGRRFTQEELVRFLGDADVFVDGHRRGGWCNPVIEAMACGTAAVCTAIGATADFAVDGETALVVPPDDHAGMAQAILRLLHDDALRARIAAGGLEIAQRFDYEAIGARLEAALRERLAA